MNTPLAYFRGFQLASGVKLDLSPLHEIVLRKYFDRERKVKLLTTKLAIAAQADTPEGINQAKGWEKDLQNALFPELGPATEKEREDFRTKAGKVMEGWRNQVVEITGRQARMRPIRDVADEVIAEVNAHRQARIARRRRGLRR